MLALHFIISPKQNVQRYYAFGFDTEEALCLNNKSNSFYGNQMKTCRQVHKYLDSDTVLFLLVLYVTTMNLNWGNLDELKVTDVSLNFSICLAFVKNIA